MKRILSKLMLSFFAVSLMLNFTACKNNDQTQSSSLPAKNDATHEILAIGGDGNYEFERAYDPRLYKISGNLMDYIIETNKDINLSEWLQADSDKTKNSDYGISSPDQTPVLLLAIKEFNISKEAFQQINNGYIELYKNWEGAEFMISQVCYTEEEINALYSDDSGLITQTFASEYAIISNDKAYAPNFYLNATEAELKAQGIAEKEIQTKKNALITNSVISAK